MNSDVSFEILEQATHQLPANKRQEVLRFIQFLEYRDDAEDADLWRAAEQHQAYRASHASEQAEVYASGEAFLRATEDL